MTETPYIKRFLVPLCGNDKDGTPNVADPYAGVLDSNGFLRGKWELQGTITGEEELFKSKRSFLVVANGGIGKSRLLAEAQQRYFASDEVRFFELTTQSIDDVKVALNGPIQEHVVFIDAINENIESVSVIHTSFPELVRTGHVVILASRPRSELVALAVLHNIPVYGLLPFRQEDVRPFTKMNKDVGEKFWQEVEKCGLLSSLSNPRSCLRTIDEYVNHQLGVKDRDTAYEDYLARAFNENTDSLHGLKDQTKDLTADQCFTCAQNLAALCVLAGKRVINVSSNSGRVAELVLPVMGLPGECCVRLDEARETVRRSECFVSLPEVDHYRFRDEQVMARLAACAIRQHIDFREWPKIFMIPDGTLVRPKFESLVPFLNTDLNWLKMLLKTSPWCLAQSDFAIRRLGAVSICRAIFAKALLLSEDQRREVATRSLVCDEAVPIISKVLRGFRRNAKEIVEYALNLVKACPRIEFVDAVWKIFKNGNCDSELRIQAGYVLIGFDKDILPHDISVPPTGIDRSDRLKGLWLQMVWPGHISTASMLSFLSVPQRPNLYDSYAYFRDDVIPAAIPRLPATDRITLLASLHDKWFEQGKYRSDETASEIFTECWKAAKTQAEFDALAHELVQDAEEACGGNLLNLAQETSPGEMGKISSQEFLALATTRSRVLVSAVDNATAEVLSDGMLSMAVGQFLRTGDGNFVLDQIESCSDAGRRQFWAHLLLPILIISKEGKRWDRLMALYKLKGQTSHALKVARNRWARKKKLHETRNKDNLFQKIEAARRFMRRNIDGGHQAFLLVSCNLGFLYHLDKNRCEAKGSNEVRAWEALGPTYQKILARQASVFLANTPKTYYEKSKIYPSFIWATWLVLVFDPQVGKELSNEVFEKHLAEIFRYVYFTDRAFVEPVLAALKNRGIDFKPSIKELLEQDFMEQTGSRHSCLITGWKGLVPQELLDGCLEIFGAPGVTLTHQQEIALLSIAGLKDDRAHAVLDEMYTRWLFHTSILKIYQSASVEVAHVVLQHTNDITGFWKYVLNGAISAERLLVLFGTYDGLVESMTICVKNNDFLAKVYIWLEEHFPAAKQPEHDGCFSPHATDDLYRYKGGLLNTILHWPSAVERVLMLRTIIKKCPSLNWLGDHLKKAIRDAENEEGETISIQAIAVWYEGKSSVMLVRSAAELLARVKDLLERYQDRLTGTIRPQAKLLWERGRHRPEGDFSDHLTTFLNDEFAKAPVFANREVELRSSTTKRKGARTDIWIDAQNVQTQEKFTLCIEVKGDWNTELRTSLKDQLYKKYMVRHGAKAGIYLVLMTRPRTDVTHYKKTISCQLDHLRRRSTTPLIDVYFLDVKP